MPDGKQLEPAIQFGGTIEYCNETVFSDCLVVQHGGVAAFDGRNKISLGLQREQEIPIDWQISAQEADVLKQVDELVA